MRKKLIYLLFFFFDTAATGCAQKEQHVDRPLKAPRGYLNETFLKAAYALGFIDLMETKPEVPESIEVKEGITYKTIDTLDMKLDVYRHKDTPSNAPTLIFIHGGSWRGGKRSDYLPYLLVYANKGYVTITVSYRLTRVARFPAAVEDVTCAVRWVKAHADDYGVDPERIALIGGSAGGHLAMMAGYTQDNPDFVVGCSDTINSDIKAIVNLYGPTDLTTPYARQRNEVTSFLGVSSYSDDPDLFLRASPKHYISPDDPPTLIFHGTIDSLVPISQSDSLDAWLTKVGVPHEYHRLKGWPHTMDLATKVNEYCQFYIDRFLEKYL